MPAQHRILIVLDSAAGALLGASATDEAGSPQPLDLAALAALAPEINIGSLARIAELESALATALAGPTVSPSGISKLTLKRRLDELGKWADFKAFLAGLGDAAVDEFNLAAEIRIDDPMFAQIAPLAKAALGIDDAQYEALLAA